MELLFQDCRNDLDEASERFCVPIAWIMATVSIEATRIGRTLHFDPQCVREEPGFRSDTETPNRVSPGLMQTLISTAQAMHDRYDLNDIDRPRTRFDLMSARTSLLHGTAYIAYQMGRYSDDPVLSCVAAYNAGSVRDASNVWNLRTYSDTRVDKWLAFHNDARALGI
jgi:hypothetical protein